MIVYVVVLVVFVYALYKERESMGCTHNLLKWCDIRKGNIIDPSTLPQDGDDSSTLFNKAYRSTVYTPGFAGWRRNFIVSVMLMGVLWFALLRRPPSEWELFVGTIVVFCVMSASDKFYNHHILRPSVDNTLDLLQRSKSQK